MAKQTKTTEHLLETAVTIYLVFMLLIFPLYYRNNYIDILRAKRDSYVTVTVCFLVAALILGIAYIREKRQSLMIPAKEDRWTYIFAVLFMAVCVIGGVMSGHLEDAFLGLTGRYLGVFIYLMGALSMLLIGRFLKWSKLLTWCFLLGSGIVFLLAILNEFKIDILEMNVNLIESQHGGFISTIGNLNFNATFDCMAIGMGMVLYYTCKERVSQIIYGVFLALGYGAAFSCRSDSVFLGIAIAFWVLAGYALCRRQRMERVLQMAALFVIVSALFTGIYRANPEHAYLIIGVGFKLLDWNMILKECVVLGIVVLLWWLVYKKERLCRMLGKIYIGVSIAGIVMIFLLLFLVNQGTIAGTGKLAYFDINDGWGSGRGYVWIRTVELFREYSFVEKLFGCGLNCFSYVLDGAYGEEMLNIYSAKFIDAHSEFLQMLATTGIAGVIGYFGTMVTLVVKSVKKVMENEMALLGIVAVAVYLCQGIVNGPQITHVPLLWAQLGICMAVLKKE